MEGWGESCEGRQIFNKCLENGNVKLNHFININKISCIPCADLEKYE